MNIMLSLSAQWLPQSVRKRQLRKLLRLTAEAFGAAAPTLQGLSFDDSLKTFASFTRDQAEKALHSEQDLDSVTARLYHGAYQLGAQYRGWFRVRSLGDVLSAARVLYSFCKIDFRGTKDGQVTIARCFFSEYYSGAVCRVISSLDAGLLAGLSGGRQLTFRQRITEGADACTGLLSVGGPP